MVSTLLDLGEADKAHFFHPQTNLATHEAVGPLIVARGEGVYIWDTAGRRYLEGLAGLWCCSLGFSEPRLSAAAQKQFDILPYMHGFGGRSHEPAIRLSAELARRAPIKDGHVFFACSGSEANDTAIKMAWYYNNALGRPKKKRIIARDRAYHGVTVVSGSLTGLPHIHTDFDLPIDSVVRVACPHHWKYARQGETEAEFTARLALDLEETIAREGADTIAAMIAEPLIGAGGVLLPPEGYFAAIQPILKRHDILLIADEVITGFGRTGAYWGSETFGMKPDMLVCAKALSAGFQPISAIIVSDDIFRPIQDRAGKNGSFAHGFTWSAHPVACAVALETLAIYDERDVFAHVRAVAPHFEARMLALQAHPIVGHARAIGLVGAIEFAADKVARTHFAPDVKIAVRMAAACQKRGVLLRPIYEQLCFCPPLIITHAEINEMFDAVESALDEVAAELG
jgi:4-aminobutyrate--pyruvate transaminase